MTPRLALAIILLGFLLPFPASAQLQYFGYVGSGDDDWGIAMTRGYTNFAHVWAKDSTTDPFVRDRVTAMAQKGLKATIDLGRVFWCDYDNSGRFHYRCSNWQQRWAEWKAFNASILSPDKVLAFTVLDEPFTRGVNMTHYEEVVQKVKADLLPWVPKIWMFEAAGCVALNECGDFPWAFNSYQGTLPGVDWVTVGIYGVYPSTNTTFLNARARLKSRFPDKDWLYVMDGYWGRDLHALRYPGISPTMKNIARDWYNVALNDPDAVLLGVFRWPNLSAAAKGSKEFPCSVLLEHVAIGRAITGKTRTTTALPIGRLESISFNGYYMVGELTGWACDPDGTLCENPQITLNKGGSAFGTGDYPSSAAPGFTSYIYNSQCGTGVAWHFRKTLDASTSGYPITAVARDLDFGSVTLPSNCAESPACVWYNQLYEPKGYMDGITSSGLAYGWVCDPDAPHLASKVRLALDDGTPIGTFTTNLSNDQAVADECGGGFLHRFQVQLPSWSRGRIVLAYAQNFVEGEVQIPWLCSEGWSCNW